ncbi:hypothetical protein NK718_07900 [Alsobacter sp. SYSU M60028]|uniref:PABS domain-containing protein n=1 Tax=Alsobacter ponti TaxID=2962936 RepID=A0ABT1LBU2_9HYPH|nr:hypothetical protein [Alsobacter ponti]MCP8938436.1 hypothetical protein [Alsobacter ponti]
MLEFLSKSSSRERQIFLVSCVIMLLELICIRWIAAYIRLFGFFINFVLLASLVGIGVGILYAARRRKEVYPYPLVALALVVAVGGLQAKFMIPTSEILFYGNDQVEASRENWLVLPTVFALVTALFVPLGQKLGVLFKDAEPLRAYFFDILGSVVGIALFSLFAFFTLPPVVWFAALALLSVPIVERRSRITSGVSFVAILAAAYLMSAGSLWSTYYKIDYWKTADDVSYEFAVNNLGHQTANPIEKKETFYYRPYDMFGPGAFKNVLIIGAGTGSDVAIALKNGAEHVDAVEIDGELYRLGKALHPNHPYDDPRVQVHVNDGRAFMRHTERTYDLIVFALTDSLTLTSGYANLRLETFLFTQESLRDARRRLNPDGLLVAYNYYRERWSVEKLAAMVTSVFGSPPLVTTYGTRGHAAALLAGPRLATLDPALLTPYAEREGLKPGSGLSVPVVGTGLMAGDPTLKVATDDWPFFYVKEAGIPQLYRIPVLMVAAFAFGLVFWLGPKGSMRGFKPEFFLMGVAFMVLEARSLVTFALLFGTTWLVNALVFFAILLSVLASVAICARFKFRRIWIFQVLLFATLLANALVPTAALLEIGPVSIRYVTAGVFAFAPIVFANIVFAHLFGETSEPDRAFAYNLLGLAIGGLLEYSALQIGYSGLIPIAMAAYALAFASPALMRKAAAGGSVTTL